MKTFEQLKAEFEDARDNHDQEYGHIKADDLLVEVALHESLTLDERKVLVDIYEQIGKWYA
jgi:hypothetical protein